MILTFVLEIKNVISIKANRLPNITQPTDIILLNSSYYVNSGIKYIINPYEK